MIKTLWSEPSGDGKSLPGDESASVVFEGEAGRLSNRPVRIAPRSLEAYFIEETQDRQPEGWMAVDASRE